VVSTDKHKHLEARKKLGTRADFRSDLGTPIVNYAKHERSTYVDKMYRYRDRLLRMLGKQNISRELFEMFDRRSEDKIHSEEENTAINVYSDLIQYLMACNSEGIAGIPVTDISLDFYLSHMVSKDRKKATIDRHVASLAKWHHWLELDEFYTMARRSELVMFNWSDLSINSQDKSGTLYLESSKTDKDAEGDYLYISPLTVGILKHWEQKCGQSKGRIFRGVDSSGAIGEYLSEKGVERAMKRIARRLGFDYMAFSGHSTRVGAAHDRCSP